MSTVPVGAVRPSFNAMGPSWCPGGSGSRAFFFPPFLIAWCCTGMWSCSGWSFLSFAHGVVCTRAATPYADIYGGTRTQVPLRQFMAESMSPGVSSPVCPVVDPHAPPTDYLFDSRALVANPTLLTGLEFPPYVPQRQTMRQLAVGRAFTGSPPHFHPPAWNAAVAGSRKLWVLWPPGSSFFSVNVTAWQWCQRALDGLLEAVVAGEGEAAVVVQHPGDLVYVPEFWGHAVLNLGDVVSVAFESFQ